MSILTRFFHQNDVGFEKVISAQHCLMVMLEKLKESKDKGEEFGAFFIGLSKAFNCIDHNLLITKLSWYGVTPRSLKLIFSYLSNRTQDVRINNSYSIKSEIKYDAPQGLVLGPLLFNIYLIDMFLECEDDKISSYADDATPYSCAQDISSVISELQKIAKKFFDWFRKDHMKANPEKCHVMFKLAPAIFCQIFIQQIIALQKL